MDIIPSEVKEEYKLHEKEHNGCVYMELRKGMYELPQAGILANNLLTKRLATKAIDHVVIHQDYGHMIGNL
eukprot:15324839-Ditylum_brightwellii.AAC.1